MYKILIIDDEPIITRGLKLIIEQSDFSCQVVGIAHNGRAGIELALELCPDIIITDINMPDIDGLEMIQNLKNLGKQFRFIILSGFLEFEYAKKAMSLEVKYFITKPVEEDELYEALGGSILEINQKLEKTENLKTLRESFVENQEQLNNYILRDLLIWADDTHIFMDYFLPENFFPEDCKQFICMIFHFSEIKKDIFMEKYVKFTNAIKQYLSDFSFVKHILYDDRRIVVIIANNKTILYETLEQMANMLIQNNTEIAVGIGMIYPNISDISKSFDNAKQALEFRILRGNGSIFTFHETLSISKPKIDGLYEEVSAIQKYIKQLNEIEAMKTFDLFFEKLSSLPEITPIDLHLKCLSILLSATKILSLTEFQLNDFLGKDVFSLQTISKFQSLEELKNWMKNVIRSILELKATKNIPKEKNIIDDVISYLDQNYSSEINLQLLSEKFYINPYYLSQLFKEKTGDSYLNYLTTLRINKAKYLLLKTNAKIYDISLQVGYSDTSYFGRLFERNTGDKPSNFRKLHKKKST